MSNSAEGAAPPPKRKDRLSSGLPRWQAAVLLLLIAWLYASILARLFLQWIHDPNFSHGIFVPLFALFVLWQDRKKLVTIASAPSWSGSTTRTSRTGSSFPCLLCLFSGRTGRSW